MGLPRDLLRAVLLERLLRGQRSRGRPGPPVGYGLPGPFGLPPRSGYRRRGYPRLQHRPHVQVRGCGCCLPVPLLALAATAGGGWLTRRALRSC